MGEISATGPNAEQIEFWNGEAGEDWADSNTQMDKMLRPVGEEAIKTAAPKPGEHVLDIGCGCADTSLSIARRVGTSGKVLGVDISNPMLTKAKSKRDDEGLSDTISFELADASDFDFEAGAYDLLFSRFGVMFFSDPPAAFANMRKALKNGGRTAFICWAPVMENEWVMLPMAAALQHIPAPEPGEPHAPGPFGLADQEYTRQMLEEAGFSNINFTKFEPTMRIGEGQDKDKIVDFFLDIGPVSRAISAEGAELTAKVRGSIKAAIDPHYDGTSVNLQGSCWIVTATNN